MQGTLRGYWSLAHEESKCDSRGQIIRPERRTGAAAGRQGRPENGAGVPHAYLCVAKRQGRRQETVTLIAIRLLGP